MELTQETCSEKTPPKSGPDTEPIAYIPLITPNHWPLSLNGTRSQIMTWVSTMIPPPPIPCTVLPAKRSVKFWDNPAMRMPIRKKMTDKVVIHFRPKTFERAAIVG